MADDGAQHPKLPAKHQLPDELIEVLQKVPRDQREQIALIVTQTIGSFKGPYPPPWMLDDYERHHPGFLTELMLRAKQAQEKRESQDDLIITAQVTYMSRGQWMVFLLSVLAFAVSAFAIYGNMPVVASFFGAASLASLAAAFLKNPYSSRANSGSPVSDKDTKKIRPPQKRK